MSLKHILFGILLVCSSCTTNSPKNETLREWMRPDESRKRILCTTSMVRDLVEEVGGSQIMAYTLIQGEHDPHSYQLVKGDAEKLERADLIFYNGLSLEHGQSLAHFLEHTPKAYALGDYIKKIIPEKIITIDGVVDPHIWMDVELWARSIPLIVETLSHYIPEKKDEFIANGERLRQTLAIKHAELLTTLQAIPEVKRYLVTTHDAFNYFTRAYLATPEELINGTWQRRCMAPEGLSPESQLSTADISRLVEYLVAHHVTVIFTEANVSHDSIRKVMDSSLKKGYSVHISKDPLFADSMGPPHSESDSYTKMMEYNGRVISTELMQS